MEHEKRDDSKNEVSPRDKNLRIWEALGTTPKEHTRPYKGSGGFRGTEYKPVHVHRRLTTLFGPVGQGWGWEIEEEKMYEGAGHRIGDAVQFEKIHAVRLRSWYVDPWNKTKVTLPPQYGCTAAVVYWPGKPNRAPQMVTIVDAFKMSVTDAISKSFQAAGLIADILEGRHDPGGSQGYTSGASAWERGDNRRRS